MGYRPTEKATGVPFREKHLYIGIWRNDDGSRSIPERGQVAGRFGQPGLDSYVFLQRNSSTQHGRVRVGYDDIKGIRYSLHDIVRVALSRDDPEVIVVETHAQRKKIEDIVRYYGGRVEMLSERERRMHFPPSEN
ncbi:hypothetical protein GOV09_04085 [Candidatus Woesearchaeota archaeon]|nr:hypothetical protein [Candidatus Woesearchaeota archaeon]